MKRTTASILTVLACILVLAAGCTSTPGTPQETTPTATATAPPAATSTPELSFTGTWNTTWSEESEKFNTVISLQQTGSSVAGFYVDGNGTIKGTIEGGRLTGIWAETTDAEMVNGTFEFVLSGDKNSFTGRWASTIEELTNATESWNGIRV